MTGPDIAHPVPVGPTVRAGGPPVQIGPQTTAGDPVVVSGRPQIGDVATAPVDVPVLLVRGADGILRPRVPEPADVGAAPAVHSHPEPWGDRVRVGLGAPSDPAPVGAVHLDAVTGRVYRNEE